MTAASTNLGFCYFILISYLQLVHPHTVSMHEYRIQVNPKFAISIKKPNFPIFIIHLITNCYKRVNKAFKVAIMDSHEGKKVHKGGYIVGAEPHDM
jgi:hypothetical protein